MNNLYLSFFFLINNSSRITYQKKKNLKFPYSLASLLKGIEKKVRKKGLVIWILKFLDI